MKVIPIRDNGNVCPIVNTNFSSDEYKASVADVTRGYGPTGVSMESLNGPFDIVVTSLNFDIETIDEYDPGDFDIESLIAIEEGDVLTYPHVGCMALLTYDGNLPVKISKESTGEVMYLEIRDEPMITAEQEGPFRTGIAGELQKRLIKDVADKYRIGITSNSVFLMHV